MNDSKQQLINQFNKIREEIEAGGNVAEYLDEVLDYEYIISNKKEYLGSRILVAFGGPNIWIHTGTNQVKGYWWGDNDDPEYEDNLGLNEACEEWFNSTIGAK